MKTEFSLAANALVETARKLHETAADKNKKDIAVFMSAVSQVKQQAEVAQDKFVKDCLFGYSSEMERVASIEAGKKGMYVYITECYFCVCHCCIFNKEAVITLSCSPKTSKENI